MSQNNPYVVRSGKVGAPVIRRAPIPSKAVASVAMSGAVGADQGAELPCDVTPMTDVKPYYFKVQSGEYPELIAKGWLGSAWTTGYGPHTTQSLLSANYDKAGGFIKQGTYQVCSPKYWNAGDIIKIPASWPAPPTKWEDRIVNIDGTRYEPTGGEEEPDVPGTEGIDRINWFGEGGSSTAIWAVLIIGAAALGGAILVGASKKKGSKQ